MSLKDMRRTVYREHSTLPEYLQALKQKLMERPRPVETPKPRSKK